MVNFGQIICGLIATDSIIAQDAVKLINVQYEELIPVITIEVSLAVHTSALEFGKTYLTIFVENYNFCNLSKI